MTKTLEEKNLWKGLFLVKLQAYNVTVFRATLDGCFSI